MQLSLAQQSSPCPKIRGGALCTFSLEVVGGGGGGGGGLTARVQLFVYQSLAPQITKPGVTFFLFCAPHVRTSAHIHILSHRTHGEPGENNTVQK